jgi:Penicillin binding protein transpeptidase domain/Penicillin-binding Protein dimerisation domain
MIQSSPVTAMFYREQSQPRRARARRALPVLAVAAAAFAIGAIAGAGRGESARDRLAFQFTRAWAARQYARMYLDIGAASRRTTSPAAFAGDYERALRIATATSVRVSGRPRDSGAFVRVPVLVRTHVFGALALQFALRIESQAGTERVMWSPSLAFPGLAAGEQLARHTSLPPRARLLARDGSVLAEGTPSAAGPRVSPLGELASAIVGTVGPAPAAREQALEAAGVPPGALVGVSGLEALFDERLRGQPGGELLASSPAGSRVLASAASQPAPALRTTISPRVQHAAVLALGGQYGGVVALAPASGEILAVAGIGLDGLQPPGSTFKMVTLSAALEAKVANPRSSFPYATYATLDGVKLSNAGGEECGGTLEVAFAVSCNSVFAPLGVKVGAARLVAAAEQFGFNSPAGIEGAPPSTIPPASQIQGELDLGSTAIGQGRVLATPLQMALVAATIADGGRRPRPTFAPLTGASRAPARVLGASVARTVRRLMEAVVREGTGAAAQISGVTVAGKTGTAELKTECAGGAGESQTGESHQGSCQPEAAAQAANTDAWFAAFAPAVHPRIDVGVLLVKDGAGGTAAAPVAREVLEAGLARGG